MKRMLLCLAVLLSCLLTGLSAGAEELFDPAAAVPGVVYTDNNHEYWEDSVSSSGLIDVSGYETVRIRLAGGTASYITMWDAEEEYVSYIRTSGEETVTLTPDGSYRYIRVGCLNAVLADYSVKGYVPGYEPEGKPLTFSVLGDSISSFVGSVFPETNFCFYPSDQVGGTPVTEAEQMWWSVFAELFGCELQCNASAASSCVSNAQGWNAGPDAREYPSFIDRLDDVADADLIVIEGGTNDSVTGVEIGEPLYSGWTEDRLKQFAPALAYCIDYLQRNHEGAQIVFLTCSMTQAGEDGDYPAAIREVCGHYGVPVVSVSFRNSYLPQHPGAEDQRQMAEELRAALLYG